VAAVSHSPLGITPKRTVSFKQDFCYRKWSNPLSRHKINKYDSTNGLSVGINIKIFYSAISFYNVFTMNL
jgi:hypothetical protein